MPGKHRHGQPALGNVRTVLAQAVQYHSAGKLSEAVALYERALSTNPNIPEALSNLALALKNLGRADAAIARFRQALTLRPNAPEILSNLGILLKEQGRTEEAITCYRKALALKPDYPNALSNLGNALKVQGRFDEAIDCYRQALTLRPNYPEASWNLGSAIFDIHYSERYCDANTLSAALLYGRHLRQADPQKRFANQADPTRRLRIGYVSADFRNHAVANLFYGALVAHDPSEVEVYLYSNSRKDDDMTARLRSAAHGWRMIEGMSDMQADAMIRGDGIDILVDLAGYTAGQRLPLFALRAAPVQATWLGYLDTSGIAAMDYFLTDRFVVPIADQASYSETVLYLPDAHFCFSPADLDVPIVARSLDARLTLGSFNNWTKVSDGTIALWSQVMREIPDCQLLLKTAQLENPATRARAIERFAAHGVSADRLILETKFSPTRSDSLAVYNQIDIALDPFPYNGCTTTVEALWMGVPVVTLKGKRSVARASEAILTVAGLTDFVANDSDAYVKIVAALARDRQRLLDLKSSLRSKLRKSPICDCEKFTRALEGLYRQIWRDWLARQSSGGTNI